MCPKKKKASEDLALMLFCLLGGATLYLWIKDKNFRRKFNQLVRESLKKYAPAEEPSDKPTIKSASNVAKQENGKNEKKGKSAKK